MRWTFGRKRASALVIVALSAAAWVGVGGGTGAGAYARWALAPCNVAHGAAAWFWDGAPGAGSNQESALLYVSNIANVDETCSWVTPVTPISTYSTVVVRAAVANGARLTIDVFDTTNVLMVTTPSPVADSSFQVVSAPLPPGRSIGSVKMTLTDHAGFIFPNAVVSPGRSVALIDSIRVLRADNTVAWTEEF